MKLLPLTATLPLLAVLACSKDAPQPAAPTSPTEATVPAAPAASPADTTAAAATPPAAPTASAPMTSAPATAPATTAPADLAVGSPAPDFTGVDQDGKAVHLADLKGKYVVVYFYPKDETPGCTKEACSFRDAWTKLQKKSVVILGVSTDTAESHKQFATHHKLPFTLVSDPKGEIAAKYGVPVKDGYTQRESFVVAPDGTVKKIYRKVDVTKHADEILADVSS